MTKEIQTRIFKQKTIFDVLPNEPKILVAKDHKNSIFRFIDLFCGIGGFRIAFERAGGVCVFSSDWDKYSRITYEANHGEKPHGNINSFSD